MVPNTNALRITGGRMSDVERIEQLAKWNRAEGNLEAAKQLEALAQLARRLAERKAS